MNIILTGFMGTGKTAVGKRLAKRLNWRFVDIDQRIEESTHHAIATIFTERGEAVFRRLERRWIERTIHDHHQVIATGGGAFVDPVNRAKLRVSGPVICLSAKPQVILARVHQKLPSRPLLAGATTPLARIRTLLSQRAAAYAQADVTIDTSERSVEEVVEQLWELLSPYVCRSWQYFVQHAAELAKRYGGKYIVVLDDRIVASGETQWEAYQRASVHHPAQRELGIYYIPRREESLTAL